LNISLHWGDKMNQHWILPSVNHLFGTQQVTESSEHSVIESQIISHPIVDAIGPTTNALIIGLLLNAEGKIKFTREAIRIAIEGHKNSLLKENNNDQHASRIRVGKATVNYWIDRLVESELLDKVHSNPVRFWANQDNPVMKAFISLKANPQSHPSLPNFPSMSFPELQSKHWR
jgi:hypothetical protein